MKPERWLKGLFGIDDDWDITDVEFINIPWELRMRVTYVGEYACPHCARICPRYDTRERKWRDENIHEARTYITAEFPRVNCPEHGIVEVPIRWAGQCSRLTRHFELRCLDYAVCMPMSLAERLLDVSDSTIRRIVDYESERLMSRLDLSGLSRITIDETSVRKGHDYITVVCDHDTGRVVFATPGKDHTTIARLCEWLIDHNCDPNSIEGVSSDMSESFIGGVAHFFPNAKHVLDPFHVVKGANDMLDKVRRGLGIKGRDGRGIRFQLLSNEEELDPERRERIEAVLEEYGDLSVAHMVKEGVRNFYSEPDTNHAASKLRNVIMTAANSGVRKVMDYANTLDRHFDGIVEWHRTRLSNGLAEGVNSSIQAMKSIARGFSNVDNMISLLYVRSDYKVRSRTLPKTSTNR